MYDLSIKKKKSINLYSSPHSNCLNLKILNSDLKIAETLKLVNKRCDAHSFFSIHLILLYSIHIMIFLFIQIVLPIMQLVLIIKFKDYIHRMCQQNLGKRYNISRGNILRTFRVKSLPGYGLWFVGKAPPPYILYYIIFVRHE